MYSAISYSIVALVVGIPYQYSKANKMKKFFQKKKRSIELSGSTVAAYDIIRKVVVHIVQNECFKLSNVTITFTDISENKEGGPVYEVTATSQLVKDNFVLHRTFKMKFLLCKERPFSDWSTPQHSPIIVDLLSKVSVIGISSYLELNNDGSISDSPLQLEEIRR
jgi:hypothetical protein